MPNTKPVVDTAALVRSLEKRAEDVAKVHIRIIGAVTKGQKGQELAELGDMVAAGAVAFSDDGHFDPTAKVLLNAYDYLHTFDKVIINHEEEPSLVEDGVMNEGHRSAMLGMKGRPTVAEDIAVARDILLRRTSSSSASRRPCPCASTSPTVPASTRPSSSQSTMRRTRRAPSSACCCRKTSSERANMLLRK